VVLVAPKGGLLESYDKQRLVPFSEYDPALGSLLAPLIGPVVAGEPYIAGTEATVFGNVAIPFSAPICFEITDPALVRRFRDAGARLFVNLSNDAWFGRIGYPEMHFDHAVFRAVETRTPVLRGANTGISGVVDATGRVGAEIPAFEEGTLRVEVVAAGPAPLYARTGDAPLVVALLALIALTARSAPPDAEQDPRRRRSG
jgi:apolipoprotein N-acyltransferase